MVALTLGSLYATDTIKQTNIIVGKIGSRDITADFYKLTNQKKSPLIVWVHGGAWHGGTHLSPPKGLMAKGYALASVNFRLSTEAPFPAQIHDIKAAIRYFRSQADVYDIDPNHIIIWGSSSGGHLASLAGLTAHHSELEGELGDHKGTSSSVQGIIDYFGPTNFNTIISQSTPHGLNVRLPALAILLGGPLDKVEAKAILASPVTHVDVKDPPMFIVHGVQDIQVPPSQSLELFQACQKNGIPTQIEFIEGAGHSNAKYFSKELLEKVDIFIRKYVLK
jgi:acetyl esterase/lipase